MNLPDAEEARAVTGYERYTITPFGSTRAWPVVVDATVMDQPLVSVGGRVRREPPRRPLDLVAGLDAEVADVSIDDQVGRDRRFIRRGRAHAARGGLPALGDRHDPDSGRHPERRHVPVEGPAVPGPTRYVSWKMPTSALSRTSRLNSRHAGRCSWSAARRRPRAGRTSASTARPR